MNDSSVTAEFYGHSAIRIVTCVLKTFALLALLTVLGQAHGQSASQQGLAAVQGSVRDTHGQPIAAAILHLQFTGSAQSLITHTDSTGAFRFPALQPGVYVLRAEMAGYREATSGSFVLGQKETKSIELTLESPKPEVAAPAATQTEFFDEPSFTVAGVTDSTNLGGHGSNTVARTKDELVKDTVSLGKESHAAPPRDAASLASQEKSLRDAITRQPGNFEANQKLGKWLVAEGKTREAIPYLERTVQLNPNTYETAYQLAVAYADCGEYQRARDNIRTLLATQSKDGPRIAELHHLLADAEGKLGNPVEAVREYQIAAELNPSELNLFDWGSELLMHRADQPSIEVFSKGNRLFPRSVRMKLGLGAAWYASGSYDRAIEYFCDASDLNPADATPYLFMGRLQSAETIPSQRMVEKLERFVRLQPENALANYYYALILWKREKEAENRRNSVQVESLLQKVIRLDPKLGVGHLQLGILYAERKDFDKAISAYQKAIETNPQMEEAHYRLAQIYKRTGENLKAQHELENFNQLSRKKAEEVERERHEIQQFVYKLRDYPVAQPQ